MALRSAPDLIEAGSFDLDYYLSQFNPRLLKVAEGRRVLTRLDPLLFALVYLPHHLRGGETGNEITLSEFHLDIIRQARSWVLPPTGPAASRDAYVAPRASGKTTWFFLILPMWAAAHGHCKFLAAFSDTATQAELHLQTFKQELERSGLIRNDFPKLCTPTKRPSGHAVSDTRALMVCESGFSFAARGVDTASLGLKVGRDRPTLIVLDDAEPSAEHYSPMLKEQRLGTLTDSILPLNVYARVVLVGTVTMFGSIVHDLVRTVTQTGEIEPWIKDENFKAHYYPAILSDPTTGARRSIWPAKWPMSFLESIEHTRQYAKNYANSPLGADGKFWVADDIKYGQLQQVTHQIISIDPAVTDGKKSDYTALVVIGYDALSGRCVVREALAIKVPPGDLLRDRVADLLARFPGVAGILVESNQGGDVWRGSVLKGLSVPVKALHNRVPKSVRAARLLHAYQTGKVLHERPFGALEGQLTAFPLHAYDDLVDATGSGVEVFLKPKKSTGITKQVSYI